MSRTDPVADSLVILKNATMVKKEEVVWPYSKLLLGVCQILKDEGYIENFRKIDEGKKNFIKVYLKYRDKKSAITQVRKISKLSRRVYVSKDKVPYVLNGKGLAVISTSKGLLTDSEARKEKVGGEVLFYVW